MRRHVAVVAAVGGNVTALATKAASSTIPIIFVVGTDPVKDGLVSSFNRPGGNATGVSLVTAELGPKRLELLRELAPPDAIIAVLINPKNPDASARNSLRYREALLQLASRFRYLMPVRQTKSMHLSLCLPNGRPRPDCYAGPIF